jgi:hypothetical protein
MHSLLDLALASQIDRDRSAVSIAPPSRPLRGSHRHRTA